MRIAAIEERERFKESQQKDYDDLKEFYQYNADKLKIQFENTIAVDRAEVDKIHNELNELRKTKEAIIKAEENEDFSAYVLDIPFDEKEDIKNMELFKDKLYNPRILSMLIWQTYFQKELKKLWLSVLPSENVCGIYKITNIETGEMYIGQAVDVFRRWTDHAKHGLGIDTPQGNKLYKAMRKYGLWSFKWELLEATSAKLLNEKESFYIDFYNSIENGYNSIKAPTKR